MLSRSYNAKTKKNLPTYEGCSVCDSWLVYSNFKKFYNENYYEIEELGRTELDKDIICKGNKVYSPQTCIFVQHTINSLFTKRQNDRGTLPCGVTFVNGKYMAQCRNNKIKKYLGIFKTKELAFNAYKIFKENFIQETANKYKSQLPTNLYTAMMNYVVEISD